MNAFDSAIDIAVIGGWADRPSGEERTRDARYLLVETALVIENFLAAEPNDINLRLLDLFLKSNLKALELAELGKQS
jgi:hypothetical protein